MKKIDALLRYFGLTHEEDHERRLRTQGVGSFYLYESGERKCRVLSAHDRHYEAISNWRVENYVRSNTRARLKVAAVAGLFASPIVLINAWLFAGWFLTAMLAGISFSIKDEIRLVKFKQLKVLFEFDKAQRRNNGKPGLFERDSSIECFGLIEGRRVSHWLVPKGLYRALYWGNVDGVFGFIECLKRPSQDVFYQALPFSTLLDRLDGSNQVLGFSSRAELYEMMDGDYLEHLPGIAYQHRDMLENMICKDERVFDRVPGDYVDEDHMMQWCIRYLPKHLGKYSEVLNTMGIDRASVEALRTAGVSIYLPSVIQEHVLNHAIKRNKRDLTELIYQKIYYGIYQESPELPLYGGFGSLLTAYHDSEFYIFKEIDLRMIKAIAFEIGPEAAGACADTVESKLGFKEIFGLAEACARFPKDKKLFITQDLQI